MISVQPQDFDFAQEYQALVAQNSRDGAVVTFVGLVRDFNQGRDVIGLELEHYPAMTEKVLASIVEQAKQNWPLGRVRIIHRVGKLKLSEQIVFVGVTCQHRQAAFDACQFIMDQLKNHAPFWKRELTQAGAKWVTPEQKDRLALSKWQ